MGINLLSLLHAAVWVRLELDLQIHHPASDKFGRYNPDSLTNLSPQFTTSVIGSFIEDDNVLRILRWKSAVCKDSTSVTIETTYYILISQYTC